MRRNIFVWLILSYICYQQVCKAYTPLRPDQIQFDISKKNELEIDKNLFDFDSDSSVNKLSKDHLNKKNSKKEIKNIGKSEYSNRNSLQYNDIINILRRDWQMPSAYLEKRGYVPKYLIDDLKRKSFRRKSEENLRLKKRKKHKGQCHVCNQSNKCNSCRDSRKTICCNNNYNNNRPQEKQNRNFVKNIVVREEKPEVDPSAPADITNKDEQKKELPSILDKEQTNSEGTKDSSTSFFQNVKNFFTGKKNNVAGLDKGTFDLSSELFYSTNLVDKKKYSRNSLDNDEEFNGDFKADDILRDPSISDDDQSEFYDPKYPFLYKSPTQRWVEKSWQNFPSTKGHSLMHRNVKPRDSINFDEILKNLTEADKDYVKNFIKCYKENKSKFLVDYLHVNATNGSGSGSDTCSTNQGKNITTSNGTSSSSSSSSSSKLPVTTQVPPRLNTGNNTDTSNQTVVMINSTAIKDNKINKFQNISINTEIESPSNKTKSNEINTSTKAMGTGKKPTGGDAGENEIKLDLNIKTNESGQGQRFAACPIPSTSTSKCDHNTANMHRSDNENLLKFLAHLHHSVDEVGKSRPKCIDMKKVQKMIDKAKLMLPPPPVILGDDDSKNCTPIRLDSISFDMEIGGAGNRVSSVAPDTINPLMMGSLIGSPSSSPWWLSSLSSTQYGRGNDENEAGENEIISHYLSDLHRGSTSNLIRIEPPYSDSFLDQIDEFDGDSSMQDIHKGNNVPFANDDDSSAKFTKKREIARPERDLINTFNNNPAATLNLDDDDDDDYNSFLSDRDPFLIDGKAADTSDYYDDDNSAHDNDDTAEILGRFKKKKKKRKKKKKQKLRVRDEDHIGEKSETDSLPAGEDEKDTFDNNDNWSFTDMNDIKFRVNGEQEEAIQKFIESLNSPPEIFNFDVDKYIKQPINKVVDEVHVASTPQRTYYEFLDVPSIENEHVPFIRPDKFSEKPVRSSLSLSLNRDLIKRDLLKEYIKGISNRLKQIDNPMYELEEEGAKYIKDDDVVLKRQEEFHNMEYPTSISKMNNYIASYGPSPGEQQYKSESNPKHVKENFEEPDEFIDKYYLLNDGSVPLQPPKPTAKKFDPQRIEIDLDLDKKFRELLIDNKPAKNNKEFNEVTDSENGEKGSEVSVSEMKNDNFIEQGNSLSDLNVEEGGGGAAGSKIIEDKNDEIVKRNEIINSIDFNNNNNLKNDIIADENLYSPVNGEKPYNNKKD